MAPEIVFDELAQLPYDSVILDPMCGSGTVLRAASELGHQAIGFDVDPLAVLMSGVWTTPLSPTLFLGAARKLVELAASRRRTAKLAWIESCPETRAFIDFWFEPVQASALANLAAELMGRKGRVADALRIALSRIIITKEKGASVARDSSHSRPHRVFLGNDYNVYQGFMVSCKRLAERLCQEELIGQVRVRLGDSRQLARITSGSIDAVITSPPYLNAIDYLRGHRLSLVWLGFTIPQLRQIRANSIGTENTQNSVGFRSAFDSLLAVGKGESRLSDREGNMIRRYSIDVLGFFGELKRVVKPSGKVLVVVGNSCLRGVDISNADINIAAAGAVGFEMTKIRQRTLPAAHRYLPPPTRRTGGALGSRMRTESVLTFQNR
jgi:SAM-dependent methyltransferase